MPGPAPKKEAERRRRNKPEGLQTEVVDLSVLITAEREVPVAPEHWDPIAVALFESMKSSGQALYMEPSDWAAAIALCEVLDRALAPQEVKVGERDIETILSEDDEGHTVVTTGKDYVFEPKLVPIPGATVNAILKGLASLMALEGDRRRLKLELERKSAIDAALGAAPVDIVTDREEAFRLAGVPG